MRGLRFIFMASIALLSFSLAAHASTITYTALDSSSLTGSFVFHTVTDTYTGTIAYFDGRNTHLFDAATDFDGSGSLGANINFIDFLNAANEELDLEVSLVPISPNLYSICSTASRCDFSGSPVTSQFIPAVGDSTDLPDGEVSIVMSNDVAPTPEPSSIVLLGTGILGFAGVARRRFLKA